MVGLSVYVVVLVDFSQLGVTTNGYIESKDVLIIVRSF